MGMGIGRGMRRRGDEGEIGMDVMDACMETDPMVERGREHKFMPTPFTIAMLKSLFLFQKEKSELK